MVYIKYTLHNQFCEFVDSERTYDFSDVNTTGQQAEINIISSFDGPMNYTAGIYMYDGRNHNRYQVQTAAWNMTGNFGQHAYSNLYPPAFKAYGGIPFFQTLILVGLAGIDTCAIGGTAVGNAVGIPAAANGGNPSTLNPNCLGFLLAAQGIAQYHITTDISGYLNDEHVRTKSTAIYG